MAIVCASQKFAGYLTEYENKFAFVYDTEYIKVGVPIGYHYPITRQPFETEGLPYFFGNLAPEGWLLEMQSKKHGIPIDDIFGILLKNGKEMIGAISIRPCSLSSE